MGLRLDLYPPPEVDGAPPVHLTPVDRLCVTFAGDRCRGGPLTVGQGTMYQWIVDERPYDEMISAPLPLPAGTMLADLVAVLGILIAENETLRTTFRFDGTPAQHVAGSGELWIEVYRDDGTATTDAALAEELFRRLRATGFDPATDLPVRVAVVADGTAARVAAMVYHHLAVDLTGVALLSRRIAGMLADPGRRRVEPHRHQPLDQAGAEHSPRGRRRAEATARYWTDVLMSMPQCNFPLPRTDQAEPGEPLAGWLWSRAAATALPHIASRTGVNGPIAVLAALGAVLAARTGQPHCVLQALSNNRFETRLRDYVGILASDGLVSLEVTTTGFDELVRRAGTAVLKAGLCSPIDRLEKIRVLDAARHRRGTSYGRYCTFNYPGAAYEADLPATRELGDPAAAASAMSETSVVWLDWPHASEMLGFRLLQKDEGLHFGAITRDRRQIPPAEVELLLRGVERLLVAAATGDVPLNRVAEVTGVEPVVRGPQWRVVDRCLVELPEARRLLQDAVGSPLARVFAVPSEQDGLRLEAYLPPGLVPGPREAHDACVALLPGRGTAMAPHRYVLCDGTPADLDDLAAWRDRPVLAAGDGR